MPETWLSLKLMIGCLDLLIKAIVNSQKRPVDWLKNFIFIVNGKKSVYRAILKSLSLSFNDKSIVIAAV